MGDSIFKKYLKKNAGGLSLFLFFAIVFTYNISTFLGIYFHTGYAHGHVILTGASGKSHSPYALYTYTVYEQEYKKKQQGNFSKGSGYLIVYDKNNPEHSMMADYPYPITDSLIRLNLIRPEDVCYSWLDYLPGN